MATSTTTRKAYLEERTILTAAMILAQNAKPMNGEGLHKSPAIVDGAICLAVMLEEGIARHEQREDTDRSKCIEALNVERTAHTSTKAELAAALEKLAAIEAAKPKPVETKPVETKVDEVPRPPAPTSPGSPARVSKP